MSTTHQVELKVVRSCRTEHEAVLARAALENAGVESTMQGALTSAFRTEAPGDVLVLVRDEDAERADAVLGDAGRRREPYDAKETEPKHGRLWITAVALFVGLAVIALLLNFFG